MTNSPDIALPALPNAPAPPILAAGPQGTKPKKKSMQTTFLGAQDTPEPGSSPGKTLLGQ